MHTGFGRIKIRLIYGSSTLKDIRSSCSTVVSACESLEFSCLPQGERSSCDMCSARRRLRPWLEDKINSGKIPGLCWRDREKKEFRVSWKHAGKPDFNYEKDAMLFKLWAEHTGKYHHGEPPHPSAWKTRFRCALHKMPDVIEVRVPHSLDEKDPYRVFRFTKKGKLMDGVIRLPTF